MIRRPPRSTLFPYTNALPISSTLQGMIISQLISGMPLLDVISAVNRFFTEKLRSEEHTSELQSPDHLVCRLLLEKKNKRQTPQTPTLTSIVSSQRTQRNVQLN